jgi:hypothetical protein
MLDALEADCNVELSQIERLVGSGYFELWPNIVPVGCGDRIGGDVDSFDADSAGGQKKVRSISIAAAQISDRATGDEVSRE